MLKTFRNSHKKRTQKLYKVKKNHVKFGDYGYTQQFQNTFEHFYTLYFTKIGK